MIQYIFKFNASTLSFYMPLDVIKTLKSLKNWSCLQYRNYLFLQEVHPSILILKMKNFNWSALFVYFENVISHWIVLWNENSVIHASICYNLVKLTNGTDYITLHCKRLNGWHFLFWLMIAGKIEVFLLM